MPAGVAPVRLIESRQNPRVKQLRSALARSGRTPEGLIAIEGEHLIAEAMRSRLRFAVLFVREGSAPAIALPPHVERLSLTAQVFASATATEQPQGIAALVYPPALAEDACFRGPAPLVLVLAGLQDPGNVGTLLRSAEAFAASGVLLLPGTASPWNPKALRASAGSAFRIPTRDVTEEECLALLAEHRIAAIATVARDGIAPDAAPLDRPCALMIGSEGAGLPASLVARAAHRVTIPMPGEVESLNAAIAGSLLLYTASRHRTNAGCPILSEAKGGISHPTAP